MNIDQVFGAYTTGTHEVGKPLVDVFDGSKEIAIGISWEVAEKLIAAHNDFKAKCLEILSKEIPCLSR